MANVICKIDGEVFPSERDMHKHLRKHDMRIVEYYQTYFPRHDKHDGKIIKFKTKEQYLHTDFNSRTNLRLWLKAQSKDEAKKYCKDLLTQRKERKELIYSPSQVELRSLMSPPIQYYDELFGDYYRLCSQVDFKSKHGKCTDIVSGYEYQKPEYQIYIDTREQKPLKFLRPVESKKLDFGDYAFSSNSATCNCYIERKSLSDMIGTISGGYERFINEIKRAEESGAYLIILVEDTLPHALGFKYLPYISKKIRATPEFIFHRVRSLIQKYPFIQFLFVDGRKESSRVVEKIFTSGCVYKKVDLQLAYDKGIL